MELPKDPVILLSFVNTKLRDEFSSLEELCTACHADRKQLCDKLEQLDYRYDESTNQFV